jgi:hypothetical protein
MTKRLIEAGFPIHNTPAIERVTSRNAGFILTEILGELPKKIHNPHDINEDSWAYLVVSCWEENWWLVGYEQRDVYRHEYMNHNPCDAAGEVWLRLNGKEVTP